MLVNQTVTPVRAYSKGIGDAVADRTINRKVVRDVPLYYKTITLPRLDSMALDHEVAEWCKSNKIVADDYEVTFGDDLTVNVKLSVVGHIEVETWEDVAHRVALGNSMLEPRLDSRPGEFTAMHRHLRQASILMSGRHLQHGDETQPTRNMEVFTNCASAAASFIEFYLLLNGSGVGRSVDDALMLVDLYYLPIVVTTIDGTHKDVQSGEIVASDRRTAEHLYSSKTIHVFEVPDSREGWAAAIEKMEVLAFQQVYRDDVLLIDFSKVRARGEPINGMQGRPASGPGPMMNAIRNVAALRDTGMEPWRSTMYADHYYAECVLVGGARRAARMVTKTWRDKSVLDFIEVKRGGFLWSSNNSVTVDEEFWKLVTTDINEISKHESAMTVKLAEHAKKVFDAICECAYHDQTGEPGIINVDKLTWRNDGIEEMFDGNIAESERFKLTDEAKEMMGAIAGVWSGQRYKAITNPCGEIVLSSLAGYCVIADVVPYHAGNEGRIGFIRSNEAWDNDAESAFRTATRALIRTNLMDSLYMKEVKRTNRIGVGMTGIHEYAWARFGYGWKDLVNEQKSKDFWMTLARFKKAVQDEAEAYSKEIGVVVPHTNTTIKPAGTTSKLFGLSEGAHLPSMREYLRWVQFRNDDPLIGDYQEQGYPVRKLKTYGGTTIVGFPTVPTICSLGMGDKLVTAGEATPEEQYEYLRLLEKYWIVGVDQNGVPLEDRGNQVSYTLKYLPEQVSFEEFKRTLLNGQSSIRCCSVMPQSDTSAYEYQPEQPVSKHEFEMIAEAIKAGDSDLKEDIGFEHVDCSSGACPVDFRKAA